MQNLFDEVGSLDKRSCSEFGLTEDLLMEHAAQGMALYIKENFAQGAKLPSSVAVEITVQMV